MIFALFTLLAALAVAAVAGWFSIIGVMAIYAGAPFNAALVMGIVLEIAKLVTTSWIYRNWKSANWTLKGPLLYFTAALMLATSIGVFGFLSKAHLEQGAKTIDNGPRVERIEQQIAREKSVITDNERVIAQLDATINSYLGKDRTDRSVSIRRNQAPQRKQLKDEIDAANKRIDGFSEEKFKLQSEIRSLELEVGPIRYIAELVYGTDGNTTKNIESAVKIFTLLIVSTLDPLAIILLVAANHSILRRQNEKKHQAEENKAQIIDSEGGTTQSEDTSPPKAVSGETRIEEYTGRDEGSIDEIPEATVHVQIPQEIVDIVNEEEKITDQEYQTGKNDVKENIEIPQPGSNSELLSKNGITEVEVVAMGVSSQEESLEIIDENEKISVEESSAATDKLSVKLFDQEVETPADIISEILEGSHETTAESDISEEIREVLGEKEDSILAGFQNSYTRPPLPVIRSPRPSKVSVESSNHFSLPTIATVEGKIQETPTKIGQVEIIPWAHQESTLRELLGQHFIPQKINEEEKLVSVETSETDTEEDSSRPDTEILQVDQEGQETNQDAEEIQGVHLGQPSQAERHKYPKALSWLREFKRT